MGITLQGGRSQSKSIEATTGNQFVSFLVRARMYAGVNHYNEHNKVSNSAESRAPVQYMCTKHDCITTEILTVHANKVQQYTIMKKLNSLLFEFRTTFHSKLRLNTRA